MGQVVSDIAYDGSEGTGGTAFYAALAAASLGVAAGIVAKRARALRQSHALEGVLVSASEPEASLAFLNRYTPQGRVQTVKGEAPLINLGDVPITWRRAPMVHLGPVSQEIDPSLTAAFPQSIVMVTPQGWLRRWDDAGLVYHTPWGRYKEVLPYVHILALSEEDVDHNWDEIHRYADEVAITVVTRGRDGAKVHCEGEWRSFPAYPVRVVDTTGAGDAFAAAYLIHYHQHRDPWAAARFANCVASFEVEGFGASSLPTIEQVEQRLKVALHGTHSAAL